MERINRIGLHGFILATAVAMFIHSTWTINTLFGGPSPALEADPVRYFLWVFPGALLAFAIDIGQIATSMRLSSAHTATQRIGYSITFVVLALAGYYLQWFHLIHHMPALAYGAGLSEAAQTTVTGARDAAIYIMPAMLPISMILYTLSNIGAHQVSEASTKAQAIEAAPLAANRPLDFLTFWTRRPQPKRAAPPAPVLTASNGTARNAASSSPKNHPLDGDTAPPGVE